MSIRPSAESPLDRLVAYLNREWQAAPIQPVRLTEVPGDQKFTYEAFHRNIALASGGTLVLLGLGIPLLWPCVLLGCFCFRTCWRLLGWVETSETGIALHHPFQATVLLDWTQVKSVRYWTSQFQGGVELRGAAGSIRVNRWILGYPKFNRLAVSRIPEGVFPALPGLPIKMGLNQGRRRSIGFALAILIAGLAPTYAVANLTMFVIIAAVPAACAAGLAFGVSRTLYFDDAGVKDTTRFLWLRRSVDYDRKDLRDARLGRQLSVGGLWLNFGGRRLEISNVDANVPPDRILARLEKHWAVDAQPEAFEQGQLRREAA